MQTTVAMQYNKYVQYAMQICSGTYTNNVESMYTSVPGHIVDCSEFI